MEEQELDTAVYRSFIIVQRETCQLQLRHSKILTLVLISLFLMKLLFRIFRSVIYVPLFIVAFAWIALQVRIYDPGIGLVMPPWTTIPGIVLMLLGSILVLICVAIFIYRGKGTPAVFDPPTEFVATGPYAFVRNPMYLGGFILLAGFGLYQHSFSILFLLILLIFIFHLFVVFVEEPVLTKQFGESYLNYRKKVSRWMPKRIS